MTPTIPIYPDLAGQVAVVTGGLGDPVPTDQVSELAWRATVDANLTTTFLTTRSFLPGMLERGHGAIITTASSAGRQPSRSDAAYAAKAGVVMFTRHLAREVGPRGVRVNCVSPGAVLVPRSPLHRVPEEVRRQVAGGMPLGRLGEPEGIARAILFLASQSSSWMTGVTLDVTGGAMV